MTNTMIFIFVVVFVFLYNINASYDTTDDVANKKRSGLKLYTDRATGLQYIQGGICGGLVPRLKADGSHMTIQDDEEFKQIFGEKK